MAGALLAAIPAASALSIWYWATRPILNPFAAWRAGQMTADLPATLGPVRPVHFDVSPDTFESFLSMGYGRHLCGGVLFEIPEHLARQMAEQGVTFFAGARFPRRPQTGDPADRFAYEAWRETPWPQDWFVEGAPSGGLGCMDLDPGFRSALTRSAREPGSFFSRSQEREILVMPARRLILMTMQD